MANEMKEQTIIKQLDGGLVLRRAIREDTEKLAQFNAVVHSEEGPDEPDERAAEWVRDLMLSPHPTTGPEDFLLVEEPATGKVVSSMNLIPQTWTYEGVSFGVGRPELVGTLPEYRNRGLVRAQFEVIHQWSAERGHLVQAITGIPYYYRIFGYEMGLSLHGGRVGYLATIPRLKDGEQEAFRVRLAEERDLPFIAELYNHSRQRNVISVEWTPELWTYELMGKRKLNVNRYDLRLVETTTGEPVAFYAQSFFRWGNTMPVLYYEVKPGVSWGEVTPAVIRALAAEGKDTPLWGKPEEMSSYGFYLGLEHPVYDVMLDRLPRVRPPYAWYVRVPDLPGFLTKITPALEKRLADSYFVGHTGRLRLTFYTGGLLININKGRISVEDYKPTPVGHEGDAAFPGLTFLSLLFGYRSLTEIKAAFPDCWTVSPEIDALLNALFSKKASNLWPVS